MHACIYIHKHAYMHTYIHTFMHAHINIPVSRKAEYDLCI
jgi:hypothetical protein